MSVSLSSFAVLTADEYAHLTDNVRITGLVHVRRVISNRPYTEHGYRLLRLAQRLANFFDRNDLCRIAAGDVGIITTTDLDTVRGQDISFETDDRVSRGRGRRDIGLPCAPSL